MADDKENAALAETKKNNYRGWKAMPYVIGNETFEKLGTIGTSANLLVYLTTVFHMNSIAAATLVTVFTGTTNLSPLLGAFLSDTYFGRYVTLGFASVSSFTGMLILTLTAAVSELHPARCHGGGEVCEGPTAGQLAVLLASFLFLVVGAGGIRPCNLAFGADQFDPGTDAGRRGINSFFNWYYFTFTTAMMISSTVIIYVQSNVSWALGLAIPTLLMAFSCACFFLGSRIYVKILPEGSPLTSIAQVLVAAFRKRALPLPAATDALYDPPHLSSLVAKLPHTDQFRFLDKAAILTPSDAIHQNLPAANGWRLCSVQQVEQVKCIVRIIPVWSTIIVFEIALVQQSTYTVFQALQSDRRLNGTNFQIPAATFSVFTMATITIWIPIYDRLVVPWLRRLTGKEGGITLLQRMGIGFPLATAAMVVAGLVEERRRSSASHMSSFWLIPQLVLMGLGEAMALIGQVEFCYKQFPENMRSLAGGTLFLGLACSNYLSSLLITVIHRTTGGRGRANWLAGDLDQGRLDLFYYLIAGMGALNFVFFVVCARWYRYKSSEKEQELATQRAVQDTKSCV
ncbi:protein NRT1/ PTR FAMILY 2.11-like [Zingiber officinale]|uniref:protein NRT1/ PTR FAMILY 2.11-like n=1 Tax=Zingiber officinale TaxID=94328 RepID=UPI001C4CBCB8|nr:protein NRT1/ PTR FAMILY 2.11-like [Zingiber officinale]